MEIFGPGRVTVSLSVDQDIASCKWPSSLATPSQYRLEGTSAQRFPCGGCHFHYSFRQKEKARDDFMSSPSTVLDHVYNRDANSCKSPFVFEHSTKKRAMCLGLQSLGHIHTLHTLFIQFKAYLTFAATQYQLLIFKYRL